MKLSEKSGAEKIKAEIARLREEVEKLTVELEHMNRELEIESSLERVRTVAMGMQQPADMPEICRVIAHQLESHGIKVIRNVQTAIFQKEKGVYINYEYYQRHDKTLITEVDYTNDKISQDFAAQMMKGANEIFIRSLTGKQVKDWFNFQKTTNVFIDDWLEKATSLTYYWFSLGPVALGISTYAPLSKEEIDLFKRFRNVFELAYRRFIDIELALTQAREARIETALERVRAVATAMKKSGELINVCEVMYKELFALGFTNIRNAQIAIKNDARQSYTICEFSDYVVTAMKEAPYSSSPIVLALYKELEKSRDALYQKEFSGKEFEDWRKWRKSLATDNDPRLEEAHSICFYLYSIGIGHLGISTFNAITAEQLEILKRFRNVFELSYRRYMDVALAETQAREAQIELALERVRSRTMAMQKSEELAETSFVLFQQFKDLGATSEQISIGIFNEDENIMELYSTLYGSQWKEAAKVDLDEPVVMKKIHAAWKEQKKSLIIDIAGDDLRAYNSYRKKLSNLEYKEERWVIHVAFFSKGALTFSTTEPQPDETIQLLERFAGVFDGTYTRFLDLQKAEAQAREAQIEVALERVRAKTMAMRHSDELPQAANLLFHQMEPLGMSAWSAGYCIWDEDKKGITVWMSSEGVLQPPFKAPLTEDPSFIHMYEAHEQGKKFYVEEVGGDELVTHYRYMRTLPVVGEILDSIIEAGYPLPTFQIFHLAYFSQGFLLFITYEPVPGAHDIFKRFGNVFDQTYTRFLDLQKAEAQAKEAQIEVAMERTRTQSMLMQHSKELDDTLRVFHEQVLLLGINSAFSFLWLPDEVEDRHIFWAAWAEYVSTSELAKSDTAIFKSKAINYPLDRQEAATAQCLVDWKSDEPVVSYHVPPAGVESYFAAWRELIAGVEQLKPGYFRDGLYYVEAFMKYGCFGVIVKNELPGHEKKILSRFAVEFERTYTRFLDLQKAEAQVREAQIEAALEKVRSRTMAMQKSDELAETAAVVFKQLINLGIAPNRLYIGIIKDETGNIECWVTDEDGTKVSTQFTGNINRNASMQNMYNGWVAQNKSLTIDMQGEELENYFNYLSDELKVPFKGGLAQKRRIQTIAYFSKGFIGMASPDDQPVETTQLLERFASVFNLTFTRFNDLTIAEAHAVQAKEDLIKLQVEKKRAEEALTELKATQTQLIQSEKMASLGELTAGIAHEIQNPLNFVNNFSDVSNELLEEMKTELEKGNNKDAMEIVEDVKQNLEKILHHGKRADAIVKGMLQHSRSSSGIMEPTDINELVDEYLRLCYHGLRAKDKSFNANFETDFDDNIGKIKVIPQDIGRMILNLLTNAFYACTERSRSAVNEKNPSTSSATQGYLPAVIVSTKKTGDKVLITVKDNGNGIPPKIIDKIFQPFFTTKPTGQGTGLGLSLSYDIIKAHDGEIKVESEEGQGSAFVILLPAV